MIELRIAPEVDPYRGELTDSNEVEWFEDHLLADDLILHSNLIGSKVGTVRKIKRLRAESAENERLRDALDHIMRVARSARQPTRRLDWVAERARRALDGQPYDQDDMPQYPKDSEGSVVTNVVDLDNRRPHAHGLIQCGRCEYRWVGVWPVGLWWLHCPRCDSAVNMHGTPVQVGVCKFCGRPFTVCPEPDEPYDECLAEDCASYDPSRDADKIFHLAVSRPVGEEQ